jgi:DMSO reductase anchor subunit
MKIFLLMLATIIILIIDLPEMIQKRLKKELIVYSLLLAIGMILSILHMLQVPLFNPTDLIVWMFRPLVE